MFDDVLLDSSPAHLPVLEMMHYVLSGATGGLVFVAALFLLPEFTPASGAAKVLLPAILLGAAASSYLLMLCYVYADARRRGAHAVGWVVLTLLLNLPGFILYLVNSAGRTGNWKRATIPMAYALQFLMLGVLVLVPLIHIEALPKASLIFEAFLPAPPAGPPPPAPAPAMKRTPRTVSLEDILKEPISIPKTIVQVHEEPLRPEEAAGVRLGIPGGIRGGSQGGVPYGIPGSVLWGTTPPPPPQPKVVNTRPIRVGGQVIAAKLIYHPSPEYPPLARMARIQGSVLLEAVIGKDGTVQELKLLRGPPLLARAALEAVQHWRYQPTLLNGEPVEVLTEITVTFTLVE